MGCRCRDIPRCSRDIEMIEDIKSLFKDSDDVNESVSTELNGLATQCFTAFSCKNIDDLTTQEKKLNKTLTDLLPDMVKECEDKISNLKSKLSSMRREDRHYHEEHKHHHDD